MTPCSEPRRPATPLVQTEAPTRASGQGRRFKEQARARDPADRRLPLLAIASLEMRAYCSRCARADARIGITGRRVGVEAGSSACSISLSLFLSRLRALLSLSLSRSRALSLSRWRPGQALAARCALKDEEVLLVNLVMCDGSLSLPLALSRACMLRHAPLWLLVIQYR